MISNLNDFSFNTHRCFRFPCTSAISIYNRLTFCLRKLAPRLPQTLALVLILMLSACAPMRDTIKQTDFYYFGVSAKTFKEANYWWVGAGAFVSVFIVHPGGHHLYAKLNNMTLTQQGLGEILDYGYDNRQSRECAQAGPLLQNVVGFILTSIPYTRQTDFTKGYVAAAFGETVLSPIISNDLNSSNEKGGNAFWEYTGNLALATNNVLRVNWRKD